MPMTPADIDALLLVRSEHEHLEFKAARESFGNDDLVDYCVAFANEGGGRIILGVSDKIPRSVVGTKAFAAPEKAVALVHERLRLKITVEEIMHENGRVLVIHVPSRPKGLPVHHDGRYLMRVGERLVAMTPDALRKIMDEEQEDWALLPARRGCDEQTVIDVLDTQGFFELTKLPYPANRDAVLDKLAHERIIHRAADGWIITNLGAILFAKDVGSFDLLARRAPRVIVYDGVGKLVTKLDRKLTRGYAVGFRDLIDVINGLVPANELIERAIRQTVPMFPPIAIRELVANALIHQDFSLPGGSVMIELYGDRLEVSNPGSPFVPPDRFIDGYRSRNERIADLMRRIGICEEQGSGIDKVVNAAEVYQLPAPDFREGEARTAAVLFKHTNFEGMGRDDRVRATYQHCCLRYVTNQKMTNQSLRERFRLSEKKTESVSRAIADTVGDGLIKIADPAQTSLRYRHYVPHWA